MIEGFKPIISNNIEMLILGTMPSIESIRKQEYYGNKRNQFWNIVFTIYGSRYIEDYVKKKEFLLRNKIGVWDVLKCCEREGSLDINIRKPEANDFNYLFAKYPNIKKIYFNGKKAEILYKKLVFNIMGKDNIILITLPSTSPANTTKLEDKIREWRILLS